MPEFRNVRADAGIVTICPLGILMLTWSPLPLLTMPPVRSKAKAALKEARMSDEQFGALLKGRARD